MAERNSRKVRAVALRRALRSGALFLPSHTAQFFAADPSRALGVARVTGSATRNTAEPALSAPAMYLGHLAGTLLGVLA